MRCNNQGYDCGRSLVFFDGALSGIPVSRKLVVGFPIAAQLQDAVIKQHRKSLRMPAVGSQFSTLAEQAVREKKTHAGYLGVLLTAEAEERERNTIDRRIKEPPLPRVKTLEEFDYMQAPMVTAREPAPFFSTRYFLKVA